MAGPIRQRGPSKVNCEVHSLPNGETIKVNRPSVTTTYEYFGRSGRSILEFSIPRDGNYMFA